MDELFELIAALSPSEKRYFKRFAKQHSEDAKPKYIVLFDAYDSLEGFDPDLLKSRIGDTRILKFLNQEKKYLKDKLLDCLRVYRGTRTIDGKLYRLLEEREILNDLGLYKQGVKKLETAKKVALQFDMFSILIQILSLERKTIISNRLGASRNTQIMERNRIDQELGDAVRSQEILARYHQAYLTILGIYRKGNNLKPANKPDKKTLTELRKSELFKDRTHATSFFVTHLFLLSMSTILQLEGQYSKADELYKELIRMWDERPDRIKMQNRQFKLVLSNYLNLQHTLSKYEEFPGYIERIRSFSTRNFDEKAENFQNLAQLELLYYMNHGIFDLAQETTSKLQSMLEWIEAGIKSYFNKINAARLLILYYNLMMVNFLTGDIKKANHWFLKIDQSEYSKKVRREAFDFCKVIQLILLYDLEEYALIPAFFRNNKRYLEREDRLNDFYLTALHLVNKLAGCAGKKEARKILLHSLNHLQKDAKATGFENIAGGKEIILWIHHKLEDLPMANIAIR